MPVLSHRQDKHKRLYTKNLIYIHLMIAYSGILFYQKKIIIDILSFAKIPSMIIMLASAEI